MIKGGYKIVNFNGAALSGTAVELSGIYDQIVDDYDKPIMVSGVSLNGELQDDAYAGVKEKTAQDLSKSVELTVYGGIITVTEDDEVSFVVSKTSAELTAEIGDLDDLETTDKDSVVNAINEVVGSLNMKSATITSVGQFIKIGHLVIVNITCPIEGPDSTGWKVVGTLPVGFRPTERIDTPGIDNNTSTKAFQIRIDINGNISIWCVSGENTAINAAFSYIVA